ncbi:MAG TPA: hypothetical protein PK867_27000, partial [Pirellulales bacterium]|nr:hypothetical protein [Pirellulales bacterium]
MTSQHRSLKALTDIFSREAPERAHSAYAGQSAGLVRDVQPAGRIMRDVLAEAEAVLRRFGPRTRLSRPAA